MSEVQAAVEEEDFVDVELESSDNETAAPKEEKKPKVEPEVDLEIVDDTPEEDRNRTPSEKPADPTEEELKNYSKQANERIRHFTKGYHDERRAKEQALREREEAIEYAKSLQDQNKTLRGSVGKGQHAVVAQAKAAAESTLVNAKSNYRAAYETGDADKVLEAQQALNDAQYRLNKIADIKLKPLQTEGGEVKQEQQIQTEQARRPVRDERAESWREKNAWFGSDDEMTSLALGYHNKLIKEQGVDPKSDEYYEKIDSRMRKLFPEAFDEEPKIEVSRGSKPDVVAPTTRSTTPKKVRLNRSQLAVAEAMGLTPLQYAEQVATLARTK